MRLHAMLRDLLFVVALASVTPGLAPAQTAADEKDQAAVEARLEAARARLEAAAREVAELSGELTGPMMQDFMIMRPGGNRAMLGINIGDGKEAVKDGVHVQSVTPGGPASDAGLKSGDVIISVDGKNLRESERRPSAALVEHLRTRKPGDKVKVEYLRDGKTQRAEITTEAFEVFHHTAMAGLAAVRPRMGVHSMPAHEGGPFTMAFRGFGGAEFLDMELVTLTPKLGRYFGTDKGVLVVRAPGSGDLKLEEGDVIVDIDGRKPQNGGHALRILRSYQPGEKVNLNVLRDRKTVKLAVTVPARAEFAPDEVGAVMFDEPVPFTKALPAPDEDAT